MTEDDFLRDFYPLHQLGWGKVRDAMEALAADPTISPALKAMLWVIGMDLCERRLVEGYKQDMLTGIMPACQESK